MQPAVFHMLGLSPSCRRQRILSYSLFVHFSRDVQEVIHEGFVYFCLFLSGLNHRQWKYHFNVISRLLKLSGGCLFCCTTKKSVYLWSGSCLFYFSCQQYCNCHEISDLIMISWLTLESLTCTDTHLKRITRVRAAPIGSFCFLLPPFSECFSESFSWGHSIYSWHWNSPEAICALNRLALVY